MTRDYRALSALAWLLAAAAGAIAFGALGAWQWSRAAQKEALLAERDAVLAARLPQPLSLAFDDARRGVLDWAAGRGRFDGRVLLLDNQQREGRSGVRVYGVLAADAGPLLVELGWRPWGAQREVPETPLPSGEVEVAGVLVAPPSTGIAIGSGVQPLGGSRWLLTRLQPDVLAPQLGISVPLAPRVLKLDPALSFGFERDLDLLPNTLPPERHRGYAVQWWGLAATVAVVYLVLTLRRRKPVP